MVRLIPVTRSKLARGVELDHGAAEHARLVRVPDDRGEALRQHPRADPALVLLVEDLHVAGAAAQGGLGAREIDLGELAHEAAPAVAAHQVLRLDLVRAAVLGLHLHAHPVGVLPEAGEAVAAPDRHAEPGDLVGQHALHPALRHDARDVRFVHRDHAGEAVVVVLEPRRFVEAVEPALAEHLIGAGVDREGL
jgi:hypothetical protein